MTLFYPLLSLGLLIEAGFLLLITRNNLSEQSGFYLLTFTVLFSLFALASYLVITNKFALSQVLKVWGNQLIKNKTPQVPEPEPATPAGINKPDQKAVLGTAEKYPVNWNWRVLPKPRYWRYPAFTWR